MNIETLRYIRYGAFALIGVLALGWAAVGLGLVPLSGARTETAGPTYGKLALKPFALVDQDGKAVSEADILGRPAVVFFGFTMCPEVCPTTLVSMTAALGKLGPAADRLGVYFVTVDPERDTAAELKQYLSSFDPRIRALTGDKAQIAAMATPLGVYFAKVKIEGGGYTMDHTASIFLLDAQGKLTGTIAYGEDAETALAKLKELASAAPAAM
jgi:protein SCO1/2